MIDYQALPSVIIEERRQHEKSVLHCYFLHSTYVILLGFPAMTFVMHFLSSKGDWESAFWRALAAFFPSMIVSVLSFGLWEKRLEKHEKKWESYQDLYYKVQKQKQNPPIM